MGNKIIPYGRQEITADDKEAVLSVLSGDFLTQGPTVEKFEEAFCKTVESKFAVAVTNGTAALHLAALALDVKPGDRVLVTPNTFVASANCIRYCGGDVEFLDIHPTNFCLDLDLLEEKLNQVGKGYYAGVVCVDFAGYPVDFERLRSLANQFEFWIIEDACHAVGAQFKNSSNEWVHSGNGRYADISVFSFHPVKHIATGEGGMLATNSVSNYEKLKVLRSHGIVKAADKLNRKNAEGWYYEMQSLGFNYRISDVLCALGLSQIKRLSENLARRQAIADRYNSELVGLPLKTPLVPGDVRHAYHLFVIQTDRRKELYDYLWENQVRPQVHYIPVYHQPYYREYLGHQLNLPVTESYYSRALSLPMYHGLTDSDQGRVIELLNRFYKR